MKRGRPRNDLRDIDLHPDHLVDTDGMLQRAKRQLSSSLEEPSGKLRRLRTTAEALRTTAEARYETAPSARELRAATHEVVRDAAVSSSSEVRLIVQAANEELDIMADEVAEAGATLARAAAHGTAQAVSAVQDVQAQAASAVQGIQAHGAAMEKLATESIQAGTQQAVTAVRASLWGAMSYLQPRLTAQLPKSLTWAAAGALGCYAAPQAPKQAARPLSVAPRAAKPAVATLALEAEENVCPQGGARFAA